MRARLISAAVGEVDALELVPETEGERQALARAKRFEVVEKGYRPHSDGSDLVRVTLELER